MLEQSSAMVKAVDWMMRAAICTRVRRIGEPATKELIGVYDLPAIPRLHHRYPNTPDCSQLWMRSKAKVLALRKKPKMIPRW